MTAHTDHPLVRDYLDRLADAARSLPPDQAHELVTDIADHLREALPSGPSEAEVRTAVERLGTPHELVDAAGGTARRTGADGGDSASSRSPGPVETLALIGLVGAEVLLIVWPLALVFWSAGLVLLAVSGRWSGRQKAWGLLGIATGFPLLFGTILLPAGVESEVCESVSVSSDSSAATSADATTTVNCTDSGGAADWLPALAVALLLAYLALQVWTVWRLTRRR